MSQYGDYEQPKPILRRNPLIAVITLIVATVIFSMSRGNELPSSYANDYTLYLSRAEFTFKMPIGWDVVTRSDQESERYIKKYNIDWDSFLNHMRADNIYIVSTNPKTKANISFYIGRQNLQTLNIIHGPEQDIERIVNNISQDVNQPYSKVSWKQVNGNNYLYFEYGNPPYSIEYQTSINQQTVDFSLSSDQNAALSADDISEFEQLIENTTFKQNEFDNALFIVSLFILVASWLGLLILLLIRTFLRNKKVLKVTEDVFTRKNRIDFGLVVLIAWIVLWIGLSIRSVILADQTITYVCNILNVLLLVADLILLFRRSRIFIPICSASLIYTAIIHIPMMYSALGDWSIAVGIAAAIPIYYLLLSKRAAIVYKTRQVQIIDGNGIDVRTLH